MTSSHHQPARVLHLILGCALLSTPAAAQATVLIEQHSVEQLSIEQNSVEQLSMKPQPAPNQELSQAQARLQNQSVSQDKELWLFGGGEAICSSVEPQYCQPNTRGAAEAFFRKHGALREKTFFCQNRALTQLAKLPHWPAPANTKANEPVQARRDRLLAALPRTPQSASQYAALLDKLDLSDDEYNLLEDACEVRPLNPQGKAAEIKLYWQGTDPSTRQLFSAFVQSAKDRRNARNANPADTQPAKVMLITASSYNPYEWVSYYRQVFSAAGAEVLWLPIEAAWSQQPQTDCNAIEQWRLQMSGQFRRAQIYPDEAAEQRLFCQEPSRLLQLINQADAVFINGGDQTLTLAALTDASGKWTAEAERLLQRVRTEGIPLAGSSAGNAVQAGRLAGDIAMISGGSSLAALRFGALATPADLPGCAFDQSCQGPLPSGQLTYRPNGGLQLFSLGITDTHFRERQREGRLLRLVLDSGSGAGFGVDEATVLRANFTDESSAKIQVLGHGGVWLLDAGAAKGQLPSVQELLASTTPLPSTTVSGLSVSRLLAGSQLQWQRREGQSALFSGTLSCTPQAVDANQLDAEAYAPLSDVIAPEEHAKNAASSASARRQLNWQLNWQLGTNTQKAVGCQRADGQWQYLQQPLSVTLELLAR